MLFFIYFIGAFVGNLLFKVTGRKLGGKVAASVTAGILTGSVCLFFVWTGASAFLIGHQLGSPNNLNMAGANQMDSDKEDIDSQSSSETTQQKLASSKASNEDKLNRSQALASVNNYRRLMFLSGFLGSSPISLSLIIFTLGVISPFMGWSFSWPGIRRW